MNIWDYNGEKNIRIKTKTGNEYIGDVVSVFDAEETYDSEDSITIVTDLGQYIGFFPSEIESIERMFSL